MVNLEEAVRYTTWFGKVSDLVIPLYLSIVFLTFFSWLALSYWVRPIGASIRWFWPGFVDRDNASRVDTQSDTLPSPASSHRSSETAPVYTSNSISAISILRLWLLRLLTTIVTVIFYVLHQDVVRRLKWHLFPALAICILLNIIQTICSATPTTGVSQKTIAAFVSSFLQPCRHSFRQLITQRRAFQIQSVITIVALLYVLLVFSTNEPLTKPVPSFGMPRKMCPANSPSLPFAKKFEEYKKFHADMLKRPREQQRLLVFNTVNEGLGNRLEGLVSAFALAVLTDRAFVLNWYAQTKCNARISDLFASPGFDWTPSWKTLPLDGIEEENKFYYAYCRACPIRTRNKDNEVAWESLLCDPNAGFNSDARIISVKSTQWFAPVLAMNPNFKSQYCATFGSDLFSTVAPFLLKLNPALSARKEQFKKEVGWHKDQEVVSLQIRRLEGFGISDEVANSFLRCGAAVGSGSETKYFLATDHIPTRELFKKQLADRLIHLNSVFDRNSKRGIQDALLEIWLLGEANNMIMSPYSTFGDIAHARTGLVPYKVNRNGVCTKQLTSHPCFFYYFGMFSLKCFNSDMVLAELTNQEDCYNF